jgi:hypothetical protein
MEVDLRKISSISSRERRRVSVEILLDLKCTFFLFKILTRVEEVDTGHYKSVDYSENDVRLIAYRFERNGSNHDHHTTTEISMLYTSTAGK